jgi:hypothetical protein
MTPEKFAIKVVKDIVESGDINGADIDKMVNEIVDVMVGDLARKLIAAAVDDLAIKFTDDEDGEQAEYEFGMTAMNDLSAEILTRLTISLRQHPVVY